MDLLAAVRARVQRIRETGDLLPALERQGVREARQLAGVLQGHDGDLNVRFTLGWFHWYRYQALLETQGHADPELETAVDVFTRCFTAGTEGLPEPLLPLLADAVIPDARRVLEHAQDSLEPEEVFAAAAMWQRISGATPTEHPKRAATLTSLGWALHLTFGQTQSLTDLNAAIDADREAVLSTPGDDPDCAERLGHLGRGLGGRFNVTGLISDIDAAVDCYQEAVLATPPDHPARADRLYSLGLALDTRFACTGVPADQDAAVGLFLEAVEATPGCDPSRAERSYSLGLALIVRLGRTQVIEDASLAIDHLLEAVEATPADDADRADRLYNLGLAWEARFDEAGAVADLNAALDCYTEAVHAAAMEDPDRATYQYSVAIAYMSRFDVTGVTADLDAAIDLLQGLVQEADGDNPERATYLSGLAGALSTRFRHTGEMAHLDAAVDYHQMALRTPAVADDDRALHLDNLGFTLVVRFWRTGDVQDLDAAIDCHRKSVATTAPDGMQLPNRLDSLGVALCARFRRFGSTVDLDAATEYHREAVQATPADYPKRAAYLANLGDALRARFGRFGSAADLDAAIEYHREAVQATPADYPKRAAYLADLGNALRARFGRFGSAVDLDAAIEYHREAVQATPADHAAYAGSLSNLANALSDRFKEDGATADLDLAVGLFREAVQATPADHPERATYLSNLGNSLRDRFEESGALMDLDAAIECHREAVHAGPANHAGRSVSLFNFGIALQDRFRQTGNAADLDTAVSAWTEVAEAEPAVPWIRVKAAWLAAGLLAAHDTGRAADLAEAAVRLMPAVTPRRLAQGDVHHALIQFAGLADDAAALALSDTAGSASERATRALRLLEAGRATILSTALDARSDLTELRERHPELAERFSALRDQLDQPEDTFAPGKETKEEPSARRDRLSQDRHRLAADFTATLAEIRGLDGFHSFASPPTVEELLAETWQGPVVAFVISGHGSAALLLTSTAITHLELPQLTVDTVIEKVTSFQDALSMAISGEGKPRRQQGQAQVVTVLEWLWDSAMEPVLDALGHTGQLAADDGWPRIWWAPGGLLGQLPLHAAGHHTAPPGDRRSVMDRVISSYTPTVRALRSAREHIRRSTTAPSASARGLIVSMPTTPGLPHEGRLDFIRDEVATVQGHLSECVLLEESGTGGEIPESRLPTKANVLSELRSCSIVHFACHGDSHPIDPSQSLLLLHDHADDPFTIASLGAVQLGGAELAYLSACRTAAIDVPALANEAIHLTTAFQLAGFPQVIGSLWEINDESAVIVADSFYTQLHTSDNVLDTRRAAEALHNAVRAVRDANPRIPSFWAAYLHSGA
ncbi:CHAT domain-containing protein [Streptomyces sp. CHD11]|uniref:CHAT domain-containing protein n=1 Tax=Streptomyces sp. CHD11 TaxID=2741325 RepID=UPI001BFCD33C|nr:CHAT domain-containing protein [Streptomyces sp. CHD11]MBT3150005.1 CHAT domain-containing protein [Streptomyces sp. CHD11]